MGRYRVILAASVAALTIGGAAASPALAGYNIELSSDIDCDTSSGEWVVTYTTRADGGTQPLEGTYLLSGGPSGEAGELTFVPPAAAVDAPATSIVRLPGTSVGLLVGAVSDAGGSADEVEDQLDGSCLATPASTTSTTSTTTPSVEPVPARPAFTG